MKIVQLVMVVLLALGVVCSVHALTQEEATAIITQAEDEWNDAYANRDWDYFEAELYCPDAVIIPYEGSKIFLPVEEAPAIWNASWYHPDTYTDAILAVTVIPPTVGATNPMILVVGETTSPTAEFEVENWSALYAICDETGEYKVLVDTWLVYIPYELYEEELAELDAPAPEPDTDGPIIVGEGETCTRGLAPQFSRICDESQGLFCYAPPLDGGFPRMGGNGVCQSSTPPYTFEYIVGLGEECTRGLAPEFSIMCAEGLFCDGQALGGTGTCAMESPAPEMDP